MQNQTALSQSSDSIHFGHLSVVFLAAVLLLGISWMKNPSLFVFHNPPNQFAKVDIPKYYAYAAPAEDRPLSQVAGASTINQGPSIINEDGSLSSVTDSGQVLGASTNDPTLSLGGILVSEIPDSPDAARKYLSDSNVIEANYINNTEFQAAVTSNNQTTINREVGKTQNIIVELEKLSVPHSAVTLQKNKILQYRAAVVMLENYTQADNNPKLVSQALSLFMQAQDAINSEIANLESQFNLTNAANQ